MKSTGIVRGIDSLGSIVLPKELRTTLHLDGDLSLIHISEPTRP